MKYGYFLLFGLLLLQKVAFAQTEVFLCVDENGKKVEYTMEEVIKIIYDMDYDFDDTKVQPKIERPLLQSNNVRTIAVISHSAKLKKGTTNLNVDRLLTSSNNAIFSKVNMEISVSFTKVPRGVYEVYLNNQGANYMTNSENFVGFMNFFGFDSKTQSKSCTKGCCTPVNSDGRPYTTFYFELTPQQKLANAGLTVDELKTLLGL